MVSINISDYKDEDHFINGNLYFTYTEFLDLCGFDYDKSVMRVNISKSYERSAKIKGCIISDVVTNYVRYFYIKKYRHKPKSMSKLKCQIPIKKG